MNKPEKRKLSKESTYLQYDKGYNHCWDDREKWLKSKQMSVEELISIIAKLPLIVPVSDKNMIATEIHKEQLERLERE